MHDDKKNPAPIESTEEIQKTARERPVVDESEWTPGKRKANPKSKQISFRVTAAQYEKLENLNRKRQRYHAGESLTKSILAAVHYCDRDPYGDFND